MSAVVFGAADGAEVVEERSSEVLRGRGNRGSAREEDATPRMAWAVGHRTAGKKKGAAGSDEGCRKEGGLLAAVGGTVNAAGQQLVVAAGRWPRAGEGGGRR
ncbi:hypothetical protein BHE74_00050529 [Ensete ventricosum]|nr:hypothetical protein GW17_00025971 [Ensete ventricosum]RWW43772.1 hypothetical protein BHE74_00050529 [Ensete ventricosum]RZS05713.1 hypothetical protein BHM03_00036253 [Ensete ventricosum]